MKIGFDVSQTCAERAGCAWHADTLARVIYENIDAHSLVLYHHFGNWINSHTENGTIIPGAESPLFALDSEEARKLWREIESGERPLPGSPDIVHSNSYMCPILKETPLIYTVHDLSFITHSKYTTLENKNFCKQELEKALNHASAFHFISQTSLNDFVATYPGYFEKTLTPHRVIHSAPRLGFEANHSIVKESRAPWLFVGTVEPRKNIEGLLDSFDIYLENSAKPRPLKIAGAAGWLSESLHRRFDVMTESGMFEYLGRIPDVQLDRLYQDSYAFLFPSHYEGFGLPVIEAMNYSLPVIANSIPSVNEFAEGAATIVSFSDPKTVADEMIALESDSNYYDNQSRKSRTTARRYDWTSTAKDLIPLYEEAIEHFKRIQAIRPKIGNT